MNKPQFTPGPWSSVPYINGRLAIESDGDELTIALIDTIHTVKDKSEQEANARLIASAPTMFDYLTLLASRGNDEAHEIIKKITGP